MLTKDEKLTPTYNSCSLLLSYMFIPLKVNKLLELKAFAN
jgi:hypothetical protein